ncbi:MAG: hypothetical protein OHK0052_23810 [Anaerolineales bacterium]
MVTPAPTAVVAPVSAPVEQPVTLIPLGAPLDTPDAELSGLAWYGDFLVFLPQYPARFAQNGDVGALFALHRSDVTAFLDGVTQEPLAPIRIPLLVDGGLPQAIRGFEGFEAIGFSGSQIFLTIEASPAGGMRGYLVRGEIAADLSAIRLSAEPLPVLTAQSRSGNKSDEALLVAADSVWTFYEVNGAALNPQPVARRFDLQLEATGTAAMPNLEYRLTDASAPDAEGRFWVMNYQYPGDRDLKTNADPLAARYGLPETHTGSAVVERLVQLQMGSSGIVLTDVPPVYLQLLPDGEARNWEGLALLEGRGFLLVTDKFPQTLFGFVPYP